MAHVPVLLKESIEGLDLRADDIVVDGTVGGAGHSEAILRAEPTVTLIGIDLDEDALARGEKNLRPLAGQDKLHLFQGNFSTFDAFLKKVGLDHADKILLDLGWSSFQIDGDENGGSGRGFSFQKDEPLRMTYTKHPTEETLTAEEIVNEWEEKNIADVIYGYGEETYSRRIAKAIVDAREALAVMSKRISTTKELAEIVTNAVPFWYRKGRLHPATKTFQALRIAVNAELDHLAHFLSIAPGLVAVNGRIAIISFHSLEDRIVKRRFRELADGEAGQAAGEWKLVNKKPIIGTDEEVRANPRSRSAKLRIIERIA